MLIRLIALAVVCAAPCALLAQQQPTPEEAAFIYELNRARQNPQRYDTENALGDILNGVAARPPLALNLNLVSSARWHTDDMAYNGYFAHQRPAATSAPPGAAWPATGGEHPNWMSRQGGYPLFSSWTDDANYIESLAGLYSSTSISYSAQDALKALIIDQGWNPPAHREHLLGMTTTSETFREVGTGYSEGQGASGWSNGAYWAIHTGRRDTDPLWLTGVVYEDANGNGRYDEGEGLSGVTITASGATTASVQSGGGGMWVMQASAGAITLTCNGGSFVGTATRSFTVGTSNMEIDFASGRGTGELDFEFQQVGGGPVVSATSTMTMFNSPSAGVPSTEQSFSVSGQRLLSDVTVTAPAEFQVSTTSGSGFGNSVTLTPSGGTLGTTTIYARFNPSGASGANGDIVISADGAVNDEVAVTGTVNTNPAVFVSPNALTLTGSRLGVTSPEQSYSVEGYNLTANLDITPPADFEVSTTPGSGFGAALSITPAGGTVSPTTIYVRMIASTLTPGGDITNESAGATTANVTLTGNVTNAPQIVATPTALTMVSPTVGTPSGDQNFSVSGQYLGGDITLTAPAGFEISLTGGSGYTGSIVLSPTGGDVAATTVYVRYLGGAGGATGDLACTSAFATTQNVALTGQIAPPPNISISTTGLGFTSPAVGTPSGEQSYTVSGTNMIGDVTITVAGEFEVSLTSGGGFGPSVNITVTGPTLNATTVYARYVPATAGPTSGTITHTSPGATNRAIAATGSIGTTGGGGGDSDSGGGGCSAAVGSHPATTLLALLLPAFAALIRPRKHDNRLVVRP